MIRGDSPNLDLLRAMAVCMVFVDHTVSFLADGEPRIRALAGWLGLLGVGFFFVHTSLVLMMSLERSALHRPALPGWERAKAFYVRRAFRIYPLSCALVLLVYFSGIPQRFLLAHSAIGTPRNAMVLLTNLSLTQNLAGQASLSGQLWSLPVELDMYLVLPLLFMISSQRPRTFRWLAWPLSVAVGLLVPLNVPLFRQLGSVMRFAPMFIPGILAFNLAHVVRSRFSSWLWPVLLAAASGGFLVFRRVETGWVVCLALGLALPLLQEQKNEIVNRLAHTVAKYSYGIYLAHLLAIWFSFAYLAREPLYLRIVVFALSSSVLPFVLFHAIERPGIILGRRISERIENAGKNRDAGISDAVSRAASA